MNINKLASLYDDAHELVKGLRKLLDEADDTYYEGDEPNNIWIMKVRHYGKWLRETAEQIENGDWLDE